MTSLLLQVPQSKRRKLARLRDQVDESLPTLSNGGWEGGLNPREQNWLANELELAWNDLDFTDAIDHRDWKRLRAIVRRLEHAL